MKTCSLCCRTSKNDSRKKCLDLCVCVCLRREKFKSLYLGNDSSDQADIFYTLRVIDSQRSVKISLKNVHFCFFGRAIF